MALEAIDRKLTTILAADVVGYSQLMSTDEEAALRTLRTYGQVIEALIDRHSGRIFNTAGDAILAEFGSAVEAVRCAISIQEDLRMRNSELPEESQMWFRIGINVGDVMIEGNDLFGDGVNVAARLEGLAEKGGVCISGSTFEQVKNKLSIAFNDIGPQTVKNIPHAIPAYQLVPGEVALEGARKSTAPTAVSKASRQWVMIAGVVAIAISLGGILIWNFRPIWLTPAQPFDGLWQVSVSSVSGCQDNHSRMFTVNVRRGRIDEPQQPLPKAGEVTDDGRFSIKVTDRGGNLRGTQFGTITGDVGKGSFRGAKPSCKGEVTLVRLD